MTHQKSLAEDLDEEGERLRRRVVHATRPKEPMSLDEALDLCRRMTGPTPEPAQERKE